MRMAHGEIPDRRSLVTYLAAPVDMFPLAKPSHRHRRGRRLWGMLLARTSAHQELLLRVLFSALIEDDQKGATIVSLKVKTLWLEISLHPAWVRLPHRLRRMRHKRGLLAMGIGTWRSKILTVKYGRSCNSVRRTKPRTQHSSRKVSKLLKCFSRQTAKQRNFLTISGAERTPRGSSLEERSSGCCGQSQPVTLKTTSLRQLQQSPSGATESGFFLKSASSLSSSKDARTAAHCQYLHTVIGELRRLALPNLSTP